MCKGHKNADCPPYVGTLTRGVICLCLYTRTAPHPTPHVLFCQFQCSPRDSVGPARTVKHRLARLHRSDNLHLSFKLFITLKVLTSCLLKIVWMEETKCCIMSHPMSPGGANSLPAVCLEQETMWRNTPPSHLNPPKPIPQSQPLSRVSPPLVRNSLEISQQRAGRLIPFFFTDFRQLSSLFNRNSSSIFEHWAAKKHYGVVLAFWSSTMIVHCGWVTEQSEVIGRESKSKWAKDTCRLFLCDNRKKARKKRKENSRYFTCKKDMQ